MGSAALQSKAGYVPQTPNNAPRAPLLHFLTCLLHRCMLQERFAPVASSAKRDGKAGMPLDDELVVEHAVMVERTLPGGQLFATPRRQAGRISPPSHRAWYTRCASARYCAELVPSAPNRRHPLHPGLDVLGLYVLCSGAEFVQASGMLSALLTQTARELNSVLPSMLVLHIDSVSAKVSARETAPGGSLRPLELRAADVVDQMVQLQSRYAHVGCRVNGVLWQRASVQSPSQDAADGCPRLPASSPHCRYEVSLQLPVASGKQALQATFQVVADAAAARMHGAAGLTSDQVAAGADQVGACDAGSSASPTVVQLLLRPASSRVPNKDGDSMTGGGLRHGRVEDSVVGAVTLVGCLDCRAYVHRREAATAAVDALQSDVRRSLQARLDAMLDAAEQQEAATGEAERRPGTDTTAESLVHPLFVATARSKALVVPLPRRACVAAGGICFCDYVVEGESTQAVLARLQLLLPGLATLAVECWEQAGARVELVRTHMSRHKARGSSKSGVVTVVPCAMMALAVAVVAIGLLMSHLALSGS